MEKKGQETLPGMQRSKARPSEASGFVGLPHAGTETSKAAAESMVPRAGAQRLRVLRFIQDTKDFGATACEIEGGLGLSGNSVRPRIVELRNAGLIINSGVTRKTPSGRAAQVYVAVVWVTVVTDGDEPPRWEPVEPDEVRDGEV